MSSSLTHSLTPLSHAPTFSSTSLIHSLILITPLSLSLSIIPNTNYSLIPLHHPTPSFLSPHSLILLFFTILSHHSATPLFQPTLLPHSHPNLSANSSHSITPLFLLSHFAYSTFSPHSFNQLSLLAHPTFPFYSFTSLSLHTLLPHSPHSLTHYFLYFSPFPPHTLTPISHPILPCLSHHFFNSTPLSLRPHSLTSIIHPKLSLFSHPIISPTLHPFFTPISTLPNSTSI